jgi:GNAT-family acetyltransferase (TIGR03103 family)
MNMYARILIDEARSRGITVNEIDSDFNIYSLTWDDEEVLCWESLTEKTTALTVTICQNKYLSQKLLARGGLNVPRHSLWEDEKQARGFLRECGNRLVVKPLNGEQGKGITIDVKTPVKLQEAAAEARRYDENVIMEEYIDGRDLRIIVIDYKFVAAIERIPAQVIGDGVSGIQDLIINRNKELLEKTDGESQIPLNKGTFDFILDQGYTLHDILPFGQILSVCRLANFHSGGTIKDVTPEITEQIKYISQKAAEILKIPVVGLDFLVPSIEGNEYVIIEANERPGLANHEPQPTAERFIDFLFPQTK